MANFAVIENNIVVNVILADSKEIAEEITGSTCVEYNEADSVGIGWAYDGKNFSIESEVNAQAIAEAEAKAQAKAALLAQLGITEEQAKLLLS